MEIRRPSVENVTFGLQPGVTFSTLGSLYFHVPLTTVCHLLTVASVQTDPLYSPGGTNV